jgi:hypothetical protein
MDDDALNALLAKRNEDPFYIVGQGGLDEQQVIAKLEAMLLRDPGLVARPNENGGTLLFRAVEYSRRHVVAFLLARGADPHARTKNGNSPWKLAQRQGDAEVIAALQGSTNPSNLVAEGGGAPTPTPARVPERGWLGRLFRR